MGHGIDASENKDTSAIHAGSLSAAGAIKHVKTKIRARGGLKQEREIGKATSNISTEMTLAIVIAMTIAIADVIRSETVIAIGSSGPIWADMMIVPPHKIVVVGLLMPGIDDSTCQLTVGCSCFAYTSPRETFAVPQMNLYETRCITLTVNLEEISSTYSFSLNGLTDLIMQHQCESQENALLPFVRTQAALQKINGTMCFTANNIPEFLGSGKGVFELVVEILFLAWIVYCIIKTFP